MTVLAVILVLVGFVGSIVPGLAGPPFSWLGLLVAELSAVADYGTWFMVGTAAAAVVITVLDYVVPSWSTHRFGGSKAAVWGCNIGLIVSIIGLPFGPQGIVGVVFWPFIGALAGELIGGSKKQSALRAAWGAFLGFLTSTGLKVVYAVIAIYFVVRETIAFFFAA